MRNANRQIDGFVIGSCEFNRNALAKGGRVGSDIENYVNQFAGGAINDFSMFHRRLLKMHAANHSAMICRIKAFAEFANKPMILQRVFVIGFNENAPII